MIAVLHRSIERYRVAALPLLAAILVAACDRGAKAPGATAENAPPAASAASEAQAAPAPAPDPALQPMDPLEAVRDSVQEAELYHRRIESMESYESCMAKARVLDPPARASIEAACKRSHGGR